MLPPVDFESTASTNSATLAHIFDSKSLIYNKYPSSANGKPKWVLQKAGQNIFFELLPEVNLLIRLIYHARALDKALGRQIMSRHWKQEIEVAVQDFIRAVNEADANHSICPKDIRIEFLPAPHEQQSSLKESMEYAVYMFMDGDRMLKCGKTTQNARFSYHHYGTKRSTSNLANSVVRDGDYPSINEDDVGAFIKSNFLRVNLRLDAKHGKHALSFLEAFFQLKFNPKYEGRGD